MKNELIGPLLRDVSRSFYLTLRVLPAAIRPQISVAYLLARATDTIADAEQTTQPERIAILNELAEGRASARPVVERIGIAEATAAEVELLERLPAVLAYLATFSPADQQRIRELLHTIIGGQIFDLERFPGKPLSDEELDRYTYLVAGCVGEFWTKMCQAHLPGLEALQMEDGIRFGKGLQLINILRDVGEDQRRGRQYVTDFARSLDRAVEHLDAGWRYTLAIPANQKRLRLACVWPIWIGLKTLARLRVNPAGRVKVSRWEVYRIMGESALVAGNTAALDTKFQRLKTGRSG